MRLFREKNCSATYPAIEPVLISESNDIERLKSIARNTAAFDLGVQSVQWESSPADGNYLRLKLSGDYYFVIRP